MITSNNERDFSFYLFLSVCFVVVFFSLRMISLTVSLVDSVAKQPCFSGERLDAFRFARYYILRYFGQTGTTLNTAI